MISTRQLVLASLSSCIALGACSSAGGGAAATTSSATTSGTGGAGGGGGSGGAGGASPCPKSGISKGPWALAVEGTSAAVRWEACIDGTSPSIRVTPEAGGAAKTFDAAVKPFDVKSTYRPPLDPTAPPDLAGTYYMHEAKLGGLEPGTCYRYALAADASREGRFCTARKAGEPLRFLAIGDTDPAIAGDIEQVFAQGIGKNPDFILHDGDVQYYSSGLESWAVWFDKMQPILSQGAFYPAVGNHEFEQLDEFDQYYLRFWSGAGFDGTDEYYRFQSAGVWFFSLDTELPLDAGSPQAKWLETKLADAAAQAGYRFSVVFLHKPFVTCGDTGDAYARVAQFAPLFAQHHVPLVIAGHMHGYERFEIGGVTFITTAGGGGSLGDVNANPNRPECADRKSYGAYHHTVLFEVGAGTLKGSAIDATGKVRDGFEIAVP
jgi:hypothetical protein